LSCRYLQKNAFVPMGDGVWAGPPPITPGLPKEARRYRVRQRFSFTPKTQLGWKLAFTTFHCQAHHDRLHRSKASAPGSMPQTKGKTLAIAAASDVPNPPLALPGESDRQPYLQRIVAGALTTQSWLAGQPAEEKPTAKKCCPR